MLSAQPWWSHFGAHHRCAALAGCRSTGTADAQTVGSRSGDHGDLTRQMVAERSVDLTMGFCVNCHKAKRAPDDCTTCHF